MAEMPWPLCLFYLLLSGVAGVVVWVACLLAGVSVVFAAVVFAVIVLGAAVLDAFVVLLGLQIFLAGLAAVAPACSFGMPTVAVPPCSAARPSPAASKTTLVANANVLK